MQHDKRITDKLIDLLSFRMGGLDKQEEDDFFLIIEEIEKRDIEIEKLKLQSSITEQDKNDRNKAISKLESEMVKSLSEIIGKSSKFSNNLKKSANVPHHGNDKVDKITEHFINHGKISQLYINSAKSGEYQKVKHLQMDTTLQPQNFYSININGIGKEKIYALKLDTVFRTPWQAYILCYMLKYEVPFFRDAIIIAKK